MILKESWKKSKQETTNVYKKIETCFSGLKQVESKYTSIDSSCNNLDRNSRKNKTIIFDLTVPDRTEIIRYSSSGKNQRVALYQGNSEWNK